VNVPLPRSFYEPTARLVAPRLLGHFLLRNTTQGSGGGAIVETEAYLADDPASHGYAGQTERNRSMYGPPGRAYVYFIYGNHYCLNVSCEREGKAGCVLFRALEPLLGLEEMSHARGMVVQAPRDLPKLASGPGRLAQAVAITRASDNGRDLTSPRSGLWIGTDDFRAKGIVLTLRIGITKAADQPLRYILQGNNFISGRKNVSV